MRRGALLILVCGVAALVVASLSSGSEPKKTQTAAAQPATETSADLPPLPEKMRPKVVEPVAGNGGDAETPTTDPGLTEVGPKPTGPASAGTKRHGGAGSTDITKATALPNGVALPPLEAPEEVKQIIEAGNIIARTPYVWGGGHGKWLDTGYDCSGSVSFALAAAGLLNGPLASGPLMSWGKPGRGRWVTIWSSPGHVFMEVAGVRFDTSNSRVTGSRWGNTMRSTAGFVARHPEGL
jgi:cell wall-associated NlpC family hydrolase